NVLMTALHLTHKTKRLRLGCGFNICPMWHPLRLAEDYATADILSGGRITFGVGRGYHTREVETFGSPLLDQAANRELFEEQVEIMRDPRRAPSAKLPRIEDAIKAGGVLCGTPEQIVEHLKMVEERYPGLDRVSVSLSVGVPKAVCLEQLERFATEIMPAFAT